MEELQRRMSSAEFTQWGSYYALEPWGWDAQNWRMGVVASTVANYSGNIKKPVKPSDFIPRAPKKLTPEQTLKLLKDRMNNG